MARELGAGAYTDLADPRWGDLEGAVDLVLDLVGGDVLAQLVDGLVAKTVVSLVDSREGVEFFVVEPHRPTLTELARRVDAGVLRPIVGDVIPLADATSAFTSVSRAPGKRVIDVAGRTG